MSMKLFLSTFEQLSELKINFHKSEIFCFGKAKEHEMFYSQLFFFDETGGAEAPIGILL